MPQFEILAFVAVMAVVSVAIYFVAIRRPAETVVFVGQREEDLTRRLARDLSCTLAAVLPMIREELRIAPDQPDETLLKRADYHFRRNLPEGSCSVYRDPKPG